MSENVVRLHPVEVGAGFRFDTDEMLQNTIGTPFERLVIIGELENGEFYIAGSALRGRNDDPARARQAQHCFRRRPCLNTPYRKAQAR